MHKGKTFSEAGHVNESILSLDVCAALVLFPTLMWRLRVSRAINIDDDEEERLTTQSQKSVKDDNRVMP